MVFTLISFMAAIVLYFILTNAALPLEKKKKIVVNTSVIITTGFVLSVLFVLVYKNFGII